MHHRDNDYLPPRDKTIRLSNRHYKRLNLGRYATARFADIDEGPPKQVISRYIKSLRKNISAGFGLYIYGPYGTGKTHAAAVIAKQAAMRAYSVYLVQSADIGNIAITKEPFDAEQTVWDRLTNVHLLVIDDMGKEHQAKSGWSENTIINLLRERNRRQFCSTIITSNVTLIPGNLRCEFANRYGRDTLDLMNDLAVPVHMLTDISKREDRLHQAKHRLSVTPSTSLDIP